MRLNLSGKIHRTGNTILNSNQTIFTDNLRFLFCGKLLLKLSKTAEKQKQKPH